MNCPNCDCKLLRENYCQNCNRQLMRVNNRIVDKIMFNEAKNVHEKIQTFIDSAVNTERLIDENINSPDFYNSLNLDENKRKSILTQMDDALNSILIFKEKLYNEIINDKNTYDYLISMDEILGDSSDLIKSADYHANFLINRINEYKVKINTNTQIIADENIVKQLHNTLDNYNNMLFDVENNVGYTLHNQESLDELRYDENQRRNIKELILNAYDSYDLMTDDVNSLLSDESKLRYFACYDYKYGNSREKLERILERIEKSKVDLKKLEKYIESIEKPSDKKISNEYTGIRKVDL